MRERGDAAQREAGFDAIQIRERSRDGTEEEERRSLPEYQGGKSSGKGKGQGKA